MPDLIEQYVAAMKWDGLAATTIKTRTFYLRALEREVGLETTPDALKTWLTRPSLGDASRGMWLANLHSFYRWAVKQGLLSSDPTLEVVRPKCRRGEPRPILKQDMTKALMLATPQMRCWLLLGVLCGLRCQEIAGIEADDISRVAVRVRCGKGGRERTIPMHPRLRAALDQLPMQYGGRLWERDAASISRSINAYLRRIGVKSTAHQLRHRAGTDFYRISTDILLTQEFLGHAAVSSTQVYAKADQRKARNIIQQMTVD